MKAGIIRELIVAAVLLAFGLGALPLAVYWVGQRLIGEYGDGGTATDLLFAIWTALADAQPGAWVLVLSPYLVWQLLRLARHIWRARKPVNGVTIPHQDERAA